MRIFNLRDSRYNVAIGVGALILGCAALLPLPLIQAAPESPDAEQFESPRSSCLPLNLNNLGSDHAFSPLIASYMTPYEQHVSFTSWSKSYDDMTDKVAKLQNEIDGKLASDSQRVDDNVENRHARAVTQIRPETIFALEQVFAEENDYNEIIDKQIAESKEEEARRAEKIAPIADLIDTDGWSDDKIDFVLEWGPRNDAYLGGSPLGGYGCYFAASAYDYGIDPRISAAISCIESGKGSICFRPHNAWGWGSSGWSSWPEAIEGHASGLSAGYGYDMDASDCARYCPGNGSYYGILRGEMEQI